MRVQVQGRRDRPALVLKRVSCVQPAEAFFVPISEFPIPAEELSLCSAFLKMIVHEAQAQWSTSPQLFCPLHALADTRSTELLTAHAPEWLPEIGLGVWPNREPPRLWTVQDFEECKPGELLPPLMNHVFRVTAGQRAADMARDVMLGSGSVIQVLTPDDADSYLTKTRNLLYPSITQRSFQVFPYYVPLLDCAAVEHASATELERWFCGASVYLRENVQDQGILIASMKPLSPVLDKAGCCQLAGSSEEWRWSLR